MSKSFRDMGEISKETEKQQKKEVKDLEVLTRRTQRWWCEEMNFWEGSFVISFVIPFNLYTLMVWINEKILKPKFWLTMMINNVFYFAFPFFFFCLLSFQGHTPGVWSSQARGQIRATAPGLRHSHSNAGSRLSL